MAIEEVEHDIMSEAKDPFSSTKMRTCVWCRDDFWSEKDKALCYQCESVQRTVRAVIRTLEAVFGGVEI